MSKKPEGEWIAEWAVEYFSQSDLDPYDFNSMLPAFGKKIGAKFDPYDTSIDDLSDEDREKFKFFLNSQEGRAGIYKLANREPEEVPSYVMMTDARRVPRGQWLLHFTRSSPFSSFDRGATLETPLWLTGGNNGKQAVPAQCPKNLSEDLSPYEVVFGFAFALPFRHFGALSKKYGKNAVVFRSDVAVEVYHQTDDEQQVIFPICSEYDALPIVDISTSGSGVVGLSDGQVEFESMSDLMRLLDAVGRSPRGTSAGSTARPRWHRRALQRR